MKIAVPRIDWRSALTSGGPGPAGHAVTDHAVRRTRNTFAPASRLLVYGDCGNIGDAIQTVAMARLLGGASAGVWRDAPMPTQYADVPFVVNGWLGKGTPVDDPNCLFAGVHLGYREPHYIRWIRESRFPVGARDEHTRGLLAANGIASELIGCATLTLPRYSGPRRGRYSIDVETVPGTQFETSIIPNLTWAEQWDLAVHRLEQLRRAELVYTRRLHVVLPCLAFGTPVVFPLTAYQDLFDKSRLGLLHTVGMTYDEPVELDVAPFADRFTQFLSSALGRSIEPVDDPAMPVPISPPPEPGAAQFEVSLDTTLLRSRTPDVPVVSMTSAPTVSALVFTRNSGASLPACLRSIQRTGFVKELVVCVDSDTTDDTVAVARSFTPHVHLMSPGFPETDAKLARGLERCSGDFVLRIDDDEQLGGRWDRESFELLVRFNDLTHFWIPRRWVLPSGDQFLASAPWNRDVPVRLFRNDPRILSYPQQVHEQVQICGRSLVLYDRWIDHYSLVLKSRADREEKCRGYARMRPGYDLSEYYLYEGRDTRTLSMSEAPLAAVDRHGDSNDWLRPWSVYVPGSEIDFRAGGNADLFATGGWSGAEPWGTWTTDTDAAVRLPLERPLGSQATLVIRAQAYVRPKHPTTRVQVMYEGSVAAEWTFDTPEAGEKQIVIPAARIGRDCNPTFTFRNLNAIAPVELRESPDSRRLGLGVTSLKLIAE